MARATGLEPAASGVTGRRSNQLSYARVTRFSGAPHVLAARRTVKPLTGLMGQPTRTGGGVVGDDGFEPPTPSV